MLKLRNDKVSQSVDDRKLSNLLRLGPNVKKQTIDNIDEIWDRVVLKKKTQPIENPYLNTIEATRNDTNLSQVNLNSISFDESITDKRRNSIDVAKSFRVHQSSSKHHHHEHALSTDQHIKVDYSKLKTIKRTNSTDIETPHDHSNVIHSHQEEAKANNKGIVQKKKKKKKNYFP